VIKEILKDKFAKIALIVLVVLYALILFADFIAPYSKNHAKKRAEDEYTDIRQIKVLRH